MKLFDSHTHFNDEKFNEDLEELIANLEKNELEYVTCVGYSVNSSKSALEIAKKSEKIYATAGISPNDIEDYTQESLEEIRKLAKDAKVVAIGEIGLDYYWNKENKEKQKELFIAQINIANDLGLPITIHTRDAVYDTLEILKKNVCIKKGIFHCCPLNVELIKEALKLGYYISFSGNVTFKNAKSYEPVSIVPLDRILVETDAPYLSPEPKRGRRNEPANVRFVVEKIAEIKGMKPEEIAEITMNNAKSIYNI